MVETVIVGESQAGRSSIVRKQLEGLLSTLNKSTFDLAELLFEVKSNGYYQPWGFNTFQEYVNSLDIKARKAQYLVRIVDVMDEMGITREVYEPLGVAKLREISSLEPKEMYTDAAGVQTPMGDMIVGLVDKAKDMPLEEVKQHVKTLKGLVGEDELIWLNFSAKKVVVDEVIRPALELAKANIGSVGKDDEGNSKDASDGRALEVIAIEFLNDPSNQFNTEELENV